MRSSNLRGRDFLLDSYADSASAKEELLVGIGHCFRRVAFVPDKRLPCRSHRAEVKKTWSSTSS